MLGPRGDGVEDRVSVRDEYGSLVELAVVGTGDAGVVISGDEHAARIPVGDFGFQLVERRKRLFFVPGRVLVSLLDGVAVEYDGVGFGDEGPKRIGVFYPTGFVSPVEV